MSQAPEHRGWRSFFTGWQFRTATPSFEPGETIEAYLTDFHHERGTAEARLGDTILTVAGADPQQVGQVVTLRIKHFEPASHTGEAMIEHDQT
jgi:hypothetical protein